MTDIYAIDAFDFKTPVLLSEALSLLARDGETTRILAGGTDFILQMKHGLVHPSLVIDIKKVPELNALEWSEHNGLHIGAAVPLNRILTFKELKEKFGILFQACSLIGSLQIKNRATIGGNICNAAPSADSAPALLCLNASVRLDSAGGTRSLPLEEFFLAPGKTAASKNELMVEITIPNPPDHSAGCYMRHTTREEMDIAVAGVGSFIVLSPDNRLQEVRIALGAVAPTPLRARQAEAVLEGKAVTAELIEGAATAAASEAAPISDLRGSAEFRRELVRVLTRRTLKQCLAQYGVTV